MSHDAVLGSTTTLQETCKVWVVLGKHAFRYSCQILRKPIHLPYVMIPRFATITLYCTIAAVLCDGDSDSLLGHITEKQT